MEVDDVLLSCLNLMKCFPIDSCYNFVTRSFSMSCCTKTPVYTNVYNVYLTLSHLVLLRVTDSQIQSQLSYHASNDHLLQLHSYHAIVVNKIIWYCFQWATQIKFSAKSTCDIVKFEFFGGPSCLFSSELFACFLLMRARIKKSGGMVHK